jgi:hypothetical protein
MAASGIILAALRFALWEAAFAAFSYYAARRAGWRGSTAEVWLGALAFDVALESSAAGLLSFTGANSETAYWCAAAAAALGAWWLRRRAPEPVLAATPALWRWAPLGAALATPLLLLSFRPVEEIDSVNYLHFLLDWMANRATPYAFATNFVAFWELSFLPAWMVTRVDLFFPLIALKGVVLLGLAAYLAGRELGLSGPLARVAALSVIALRHLWFGYSGVPTLKNDALHGAGFLLLTLAVLRAARKDSPGRSAQLLAFGAAFACVKYSGLFFAIPAALAVAWLLRDRIRLRPRSALLAACAGCGFFALTSGHYYLRSLLAHGSPFYPFQINLGPIHLPGTADLSYTAISNNLGDPRLWRALFYPGLSPAGLLFPVTLAAGLLVPAALLACAVWRRAAGPAEWAAAAILLGWLLYFRTIFGACAQPGDLAFIVNGLNSIRYVDGVLALTEILLLAMLARRPRLVVALALVSAASRLYILYAELRPDRFPWAFTLALAALAGGMFWLLARFGPKACAGFAAAALVFGGPFAVERNRQQWTTYWNALKPALSAERPLGLAQLALPDGSYFAGHVVAAGNPVDPSVRALTPDEMSGLPAGARPRFLAVLLTPGSSPGWEARYSASLAAWGYRLRQKNADGAIFER